MLANLIPHGSLWAPDLWSIASWFCHARLRQLKPLRHTDYWRWFGHKRLRQTRSDSAISRRNEQESYRPRVPYLSCVNLSCVKRSCVMEGLRGETSDCCQRAVSASAISGYHEPLIMWYGCMWMTWLCLMGGWWLDELIKVCVPDFTTANPPCHDVAILWLPPSVPHPPRPTHGWFPCISPVHASSPLADCTLANEPTCVSQSPSLIHFNHLSFPFPVTNRSRGVSWFVIRDLWFDALGHGCEHD